jgi:hypothetical protein
MVGIKAKRAAKQCAELKYGSRCHGRFQWAIKSETATPFKEA